MVSLKEKKKLPQSRRRVDRYAVNQKEKVKEVGENSTLYSPSSTSSTLRLLIFPSV
jgi:hypothetical protein